MNCRCNLAVPIHPHNHIDRNHDLRGLMENLSSSRGPGTHCLTELGQQLQLAVCPSFDSSISHFVLVSVMLNTQSGQHIYRIAVSYF